MKFPTLLLALLPVSATATTWHYLDATALAPYQVVGSTVELPNLDDDESLRGAVEWTVSPTQAAQISANANGQKKVLFKQPGTVTLTARSRQLNQPVTRTVNVAMYDVFPQLIEPQCVMGEVRQLPARLAPAGVYLSWTYTDAATGQPATGVGGMTESAQGLNESGSFLLSATDRFGNQPYTNVPVTVTAQGETLDQLLDTYPIGSSVVLSGDHTYTIAEGTAALEGKSDYTRVTFNAAGTLTLADDDGTSRQLTVTDNRTLSFSAVADVQYVGLPFSLPYFVNYGDGPAYRCDPADHFTLNGTSATIEAEGSYTISAIDAQSTHVLATKTITVASPDLDGGTHYLGETVTLPTKTNGRQHRWEQSSLICFTTGDQTIADQANGGVFTYNFSVVPPPRVLEGKPTAALVGGFIHVAAPTVTVTPEGAAQVDHPSAEVCRIMYTKPGTLTMNAAGETLTVTVEQPAVRYDGQTLTRFLGDYTNVPDLDDSYHTITWAYSPARAVNGSRLVATGNVTANATDAWGNHAATINFIVNEDALPRPLQLSETYTVGDQISLDATTLNGSFSLDCDGAYVRSVYANGSYQLTFLEPGQVTLTMHKGDRDQVLQQCLVNVNPMAADLADLTVTQGDRIELPATTNDGSPLTWTTDPDATATFVKRAPGLITVVFEKDGDLTLNNDQGQTKRVHVTKPDITPLTETSYLIDWDFNLPATTSGGLPVTWTIVEPTVVRKTSTQQPKYHFEKPQPCPLRATDPYGNVTTWTFTGHVEPVDLTALRGPYVVGSEDKLAGLKFVAFDPALNASYDTRSGRIVFNEPGDVTMIVSDRYGNERGRKTWTVGLDVPDFSALKAATVGVPVVMPSEQGGRALTYSAEGLLTDQADGFTRLTFTKPGDKIALSARSGNYVMATSVAVTLDAVNTASLPATIAAGRWYALPTTSAQTLTLTWTSQSPGVTIEGDKVRADNPGLISLVAADKWGNPHEALDAQGNTRASFDNDPTVTVSPGGQGNILASIDAITVVDDKPTCPLASNYLVGDAAVELPLYTDLRTPITYDLGGMNSTRTASALSLLFDTPGSFLVTATVNGTQAWQTTIAVDMPTLDLDDLPTKATVGQKIMLPNTDQQLTLTWQTDDATIAALVNNADYTAVTFLKAGTVTLTAAATNHEPEQWSIDVADDELDLSGIKEQYVVGLTPVPLPALSAAGLTVTWTSSNEAVLSPEGVPLTAGTATLTATGPVANTLATKTITTVLDHLDLSNVPTEFIVGDRLTLPTNGKAGAYITWATAPLVAGNNGVFNFIEPAHVTFTATDKQNNVIATLTVDVASGVVEPADLPEAVLVGQRLQLPNEIGGFPVTWKANPAHQVDFLNPANTLITFVEPTELGITLTATDDRGRVLTEKTLTVTLPTVTPPQGLRVGNTLTPLPATTDNDLDLTWQGNAYVTCHTPGTYHFEAVDTYGHAYAINVTVGWASVAFPDTAGLSQGYHIRLPATTDTGLPIVWTDQQAMTITEVSNAVGTTTYTATDEFGNVYPSTEVYIAPPPSALPIVAVSSRDEVARECDLLGRAPNGGARIVVRGRKLCLVRH